MCFACSLFPREACALFVNDCVREKQCDLANDLTCYVNAISVLLITHYNANVLVQQMPDHGARSLQSAVTTPLVCVWDLATMKPTHDKYQTINVFLVRL